MAPRQITLRVNGTTYTGQAEPRKTLADFIREDCGLTGTHLGCEHGVCGACTILMDGDAVRSCLLFAVQAEGAELMTVEGLADDDRLHPIQQAYWDHHALQCGFCTPGFLITTYAFLRDNPKPSEREIREGLAGNLCRCTGYQNIVKAVAAAGEMRAAGAEFEPGWAARMRRESRAAAPAMTGPQPGETASGAGAGAPRPGAAAKRAKSRRSAAKNTAARPRGRRQRKSSR
jgi:aerobic carbon-monoxide dehydrogenase small subunit